LRQESDIDATRELENALKMYQANVKKIQVDALLHLPQATREMSADRECF
jgi:hypothetical protein